MNVESIHKVSRPVTRDDIAAILLMVSLTLLVYWPSLNHDFVNFDDHLYVTENAPVLKGVSLANLKWAIHSTDSFNWHPLTWLSHMLDVELFGLKAGGHHLTSVVFHIFNALLLFILLKGMSGALWPSAFAAALFGLHPLHVESVAWISERKDVLSTFFGLLALMGYMRYAQQRSRSGYMLALLFFILGLMSKPMLVTLPFVMLLLDYWPLGRVQFEAGFRLRPAGQAPSVFSLLLEKIPFFILTAASCVVTYYAQQSGGAVQAISRLPLALRIENAIISYVAYIGKMFWPTRLAVFYPYPEAIAVWKVVAAAVLLAGVFILVMMQIRRRPYGAVGWLWYVGTLVPVIGLVQVGSQAMADRYTYVPMIGLFIMIAWGAAEIVGRWRLKPLWVALTAGMLLLALTLTSRTQVGHWADSLTLYAHALEVTENNATAHNNLALALTARRKYPEALHHISAAVDLTPGNPSATNNLGYVQMKQGRYEEAIRNFERALDLYPGYWKAHQNLATVFLQSGKIDMALSHYQAALAIAPHNKNVLNDFANVLVMQNRAGEALPYYETALGQDPDDAEIHNNYGVALLHLGQLEKGTAHFRKALQLDPAYVEAGENLARALKKNP